jgi:hypothetical protein
VCPLDHAAPFAPCAYIVAVYVPVDAPTVIGALAANVAPGAIAYCSSADPQLGIVAVFGPGGWYAEVG